MKQYDNLGFQSGYFIKKDQKIIEFEGFHKSFDYLDFNTIDPTAIIQFVNYFYFLGDRTVLKNIKKTPWLSQLAPLKDEWSISEIETKRNNIKSVKQFADELEKELTREIASYIKDKNQIGILLTGGMDSRIVASILHNLTKNNNQINVYSYTWGTEKSRDVNYAQIISKKYGWTFKRIELNAEVLRKNIILTAERGCEFSPVHLHGMEAISEQSHLDLILAGSYGDSMGRGEYSGKHVSKIKSIQSSLHNRFLFVNQNVYKKYKAEIKEDILLYRKRFPRRHDYSYYEIERQAHYMRRELNPCMKIIDEKIPLYQCFAIPVIYNLVLNTDPKLRTDEVYYHILNNQDSSLLNIPWARTGKLYFSEHNELPDTYEKDSHRYGDWVKNDLYNYIYDELFSGELEKLNVFNMGALKNLITLNRKYGSKKVNRIDELLVWLTSFSLMVKKYNLESDIKPQDPSLFYSFLSYAYIRAYLLLSK